MKSNLKTSTTGSLSEATAKELMNKYQPVVYLHKSEKYFPSKIENFGIDWNSATFYNADVLVTYTYKGPASFDNSVPMYVSMTEDTSANTVKISYVFLYAYNGCGPSAKVKAKLIGLGVNDYYSMCPADVHWGDVEHIEVTLSRASSGAAYTTLKKIKYAFHEWSDTYTNDGTEDGKISDNVTFEDSTHPRVYSALGSHASYPKSGDISYLTLFDKSGTGYSAYAKLTDFCGSQYRWYGSAKLIKLNGAAVSGISTEENNVCFKFYGRLGAKIENNDTNDLEKVLKTIKSTAKSLGISKIKNACDDALDALDKYYEASGSKSIGSPSRSSWW